VILEFNQSKPKQRRQLNSSRRSRS